MVLSAVLSALLVGIGQGQTVTTIAGTGTPSFSGDNGPATQASFNNPVYLAFDAAGNLIVADWRNHRVRRIGTDGTVTTIAGTGAAGFSGDGGAASQASFNGVIGVCVDPSGNIYVNDDANNRIRRIDPSGRISTFAGNGARLSAGDGGNAVQASFFIGIRCASDASGNLYVAEQGAHRVRRISIQGIVSTVAGTGSQGFSGEGGPAVSAQLNNPTAVTVDRAGNLYICDQFNHRIRRVSPSGTIVTVAGTGTAGFSGDGGPGVAASLNFPGAMVMDANGDLYFTDGPNARVRKLSAAGILTTVAGNGVRGFAGDDGPALSASFNGAFGIALDARGNLYVADTENHRIRRISNASAAGAEPEFDASGVSAWGSLQTGVTPGALTVIRGRNLALGASGITTAESTPLPKLLSGVSVKFGEDAVPIMSVRNTAGMEQVVVQAPFSLTGETVAVTVDNGRAVSRTVQVRVASAQPSLISLDGLHVAASRGSDGALVSELNPAAAGDHITLFGLAFGRVEPAPETGAPAAGNPLSSMVTPLELRIGGRAAEVSFAGIAPGFIGLYQINARVPDGLVGLLSIEVTAEGVSSPELRIPVR